MRRGLLFIVSAPSGTGKTTLAERLVRSVPNLVRSRSYTSRPPRAGEQDGVDYNFVDESRFAAMVAAGGFLEWAEVFGYRYGTGAEDTERHRLAGRDVVLVIDVQGAQKVRERGVNAVSIFVLPPSRGALEERLGRRAAADRTRLHGRLEAARREVAASGSYDYRIVNDDFDSCLAQLRSIVIAERSRVGAADDAIDGIVAEFDASDA